jgi:hypothetical protein
VGLVTRSIPEESAPKSRDQSLRLRGADAFRLHLTLAAGLALCIGAFSFELVRALSGHTFSWLYVFEWPFFAGFGIYLWWNLLNGYDRHPHHSSTRRLPAHEDGDESDELKAWQSYLRSITTTEHNEKGKTN